MPLEPVDLLIVGGGITGVSIGRLLQQSGNTSFVILEKESEPGGLCRSQVVDGHVLDIGGGHFLASKYPEVYGFIFQHLPESEFNRFVRVSKISLPEGVIDYPVEYNIWQLPAEPRLNYLISYLNSWRDAANEAPRDFEGWVRAKLGVAIAERYMIPYNRKIWGVEPNELDVDWLEKIPPVDLVRVLRACLEREAAQAVMPSHQTFYYPKVGGFQTLFDAICRTVTDHIVTDSPVTSLRRSQGNWIVNERYLAKAVVNTIPWPDLAGLTEGGPDVAALLPLIRTTGLVVTLHDDEPYEHNWHWNYMCDPELAHHREFYIHNFAPHSARHGIFRETNPRGYVERPGTLKAIHNRHAYPIPTRGHTGAVQATWDAFANVGIVGVGRWGQHRYYNSDVCIREAMRFAAGYLDGGILGGAEALRGEGSRKLT